METPEEPKKGKKKLIIIGAVVIALAAGGGFFFLGGDKAEASVVEEPAEPVEGPVIEGDQMTVNLADEESRYARLTFAVVLAAEADSGAVGERMPLLKDAILDAVAGYKAADLRAPGALDDLRAAFTERAQDVYADGSVLRVVITELLVQ